MKTFEKIANIVIKGDKEKIVKVINEALEQRINPIDILEEGLVRGIEVVGDKFEKLEIYLPEMILSAETMKVGINMLEPHIEARGDRSPLKKEGTVVIGTTQGDIHDIGKNIVSAFLDVSGFKVHDLGTGVPAQVFVEKAEEKQADIIGISALLTTTMIYMRDVINELKNRKLREKYLVIVGGGAVTPDWTREIGADGYGKDFVEAVKVAKQLIEPRRGRE